MTTLLRMIHAIDEHLEAALVPHAFGGALALAYCIGEPRATADIDVNVFLRPDRVDTVLAALPDEVGWDDEDRRILERDGQARLWWDRTPIDVFLSTTAFHDGAAARTHREELGGRTVPFLSCDDLAVFKAFFNRRKDWADLEAMVRAERFDVDRAIGVIARHLGPDDHRIAQLIELTQLDG